MPYSYTYVSYWTDDAPGMDKLKEAFQEIEADFIGRSPHVSTLTRMAMEKRLDTLRNAWYFMLEPVPKPFE